MKTASRIQQDVVLRQTFNKKKRREQYQNTINFKLICFRGIEQVLRSGR
jgi:hypothetical protein